MATFLLSAGGRGHVTVSELVDCLCGSQIEYTTYLSFLLLCSALDGGEEFTERNGRGDEMHTGTDLW